VNAGFSSLNISERESWNNWRRYFLNLALSLYRFSAAKDQISWIEVVEDPAWLRVRTFDDAKKPKHNNTIPVGTPDIVVDVSNG